MSEVNTLTSNITTQVGTFLGASYSELKHKYEVEKNFVKGSSKKYGVVPRDINEVAGSVCFIHVEQQFEVIITDTYKTITTGDSPKDNAVRALSDLGLDLYVDIVNNKASSANIVININDFNSTIEELDEDKLILNRITFTIQYRKSK